MARHVPSSACGGGLGRGRYGHPARHPQNPFPEKPSLPYSPQRQEATSLTNKSAPKNLVEWLGYTTNPRYSQHFWLGIIIGGILCAFIASALLITSVYFLGALTGGKDIIESVSGEAALNYLLIIGGIVGAPFVVWRILVNQKLADIAEQGLITDRLNKAVEQLGAEKTILKKGGAEMTIPNLTVRLGAIFTLERISQDSLRDHIMVMEILSAYIRYASEKKTLKLDLNDHSDVQAALSIIGRRSVERIEYERNPDKNGTQKPYQINLRNIKIRGADFKNARLSHIDFTNTTLHDANFDGAQLDHTDFSFADLTESTFNGARLSNVENFATGEPSLTIFHKANVYDCRFGCSQKLHQHSINNMYGAYNTTVPYGLTKPRNWGSNPITAADFRDNWNTAVDPLHG